MYPHRAMDRLWELALIHKHKHKPKYGFGHRKAQFSQLLVLLEREESLAVSDLLCLAEVRESAVEATKYGEPACPYPRWALPGSGR